MESSRPLGPLVEMIGPFIKMKYDGFKSEAKQFLDTHSCVAYIVFGQHFVPTEGDTECIMATLINQLENSLIDSIYWASSPNILNLKFQKYNGENNNNNNNGKKTINDSFINKKKVK